MANREAPPLHVQDVQLIKKDANGGGLVTYKVASGEVITVGISTLRVFEDVPASAPTWGVLKRRIGIIIPEVCYVAAEIHLHPQQ